MTFMIEKNVPMPTSSKPGAPNKGYDILLTRMKVGDSVVVPRAALASIRSYAKKLGCEIATRKVDQYKRRVWMLQKETV
jgi:hypothetical protein